MKSWISIRTSPASTDPGDQIDFYTKKRPRLEEVEMRKSEDE